MVAPKIIFRDISIQYASCLIPIYEEMKKQGFNCELQYLNIQEWDNLERFIAYHENDKYDLLVTATGGRDIYHHFKLFAKFTTLEQRAKDMFNYVKARRINSILIAHSVGYEEPNEFYSQFKAVFLTGLEDMEKFRKFGLKNLHLIGYPKLDVLSASRDVKIELAKKIRAEVGYLPFSKTVLYAPTIKRLGSFDDSIMHLLKIFRELDINLLIKIHCGDLDKMNPLKLLNKAKTYALNMANVKWLNNSNVASIVPLYLMSDVLISGASGCLREFMLVDKPSIQLTNVNTDRFSYNGCIKSDLINLQKNIIRAIYIPEIMREERQSEIKKWLYKPDGHASNRAVKRIKEIMKW